MFIFNDDWQSCFEKYTLKSCKILSFVCINANKRVAIGFEIGLKIEKKNITNFLFLVFHLIIVCYNMYFKKCCPVLPRPPFRVDKRGCPLLIGSKRLQCFVWSITCREIQISKMHYWSNAVKILIVIPSVVLDLMFLRVTCINLYSHCKWVSHHLVKAHFRIHVRTNISIIKRQLYESWKNGFVYQRQIFFQCILIKSQSWCFFLININSHKTIDSRKISEHISYTKDTLPLTSINCIKHIRYVSS